MPGELAKKKIGYWLTLVAFGPFFASACLGSQRPELTVPEFRVGDTAVWEGEGVWRSYVIVAQKNVSYPDEPYPRPVVQIEVRRYPGDPAPQTILRVDARTGSVVETIALCDHRVGEQCIRDYVRSRLSRSDLVPWGFGSSLFAGLTLRPGDRFERSFHAGSAQFSVAYEVEGIFRMDNRLVARVRGTSDMAENLWGPDYAFRGVFEVTGDSPFVLSTSQTDQVVSDFVETPIPIRIDIVRTSEGRGVDPVEFPPSGTVPPIPPEPLAPRAAWSGIYFPGADAVDAPYHSSFGEFLAYAVSNGLASNEPGAFRRLTLSNRSTDQTDIGPYTLSRRQVELRASFATTSNETKVYNIVKSFEEPQVLMGPQYSHEAAGVESLPRPSTGGRELVSYRDSRDFVVATFGISQYTPLVLLVGNGFPGGHPFREDRLVYSFNYPLAEAGSNGGQTLIPISVDAVEGGLREISLPGNGEGLFGAR